MAKRKTKPKGTIEQPLNGQKKKKESGKRICYSLELAESVCHHIAGGLALKEVAQIAGMPARSTAHQWLREHSEFAVLYARAREERADLIADEVIAIADSEPDPHKARVRIDARKWWAAKVNPKKYGDRTELTGANGGPIEIKSDGTDLELARRVGFLLGRAVATPLIAAPSDIQSEGLDGQVIDIA